MAELYYHSRFVVVDKHGRSEVKPFMLAHMNEALADPENWEQYLRIYTQRNCLTTRQAERLLATWNKNKTGDRFSLLAPDREYAILVA